MVSLAAPLTCLADSSAFIWVLNGLSGLTCFEAGFCVVSVSVVVVTLGVAGVALSLLEHALMANKGMNNMNRYFIRFSLCVDCIFIYLYVTFKDKT